MKPITPVVYLLRGAGGDYSNWHKNGVNMIIDCGTEDFLLDINRQMHQLLLEAGVAHDYIERPGAHNWEYWTNALPYHFLFFDALLRK